MTYTVQFTDKSKTPISIDDNTINSSLGFVLFGRNKVSYGQDIQEDLLHLLESFSAPEDSTSHNTPDLSKVIDNVLSSPIEGHLWYNSTNETLNWYDGTVWQPLSQDGDIAANWGTINDGEVIPKPISSLTGKVFDYPECAWIVSPYSLPVLTDGFTCTTDDNALVTMTYKSGSTSVSGVANYFIVGITGNNNHKPVVTPTPTVTQPLPLQ